ncbi:MAG: hypothetical protein HUU35_02750 [Armatimonadetes bacterium]|nr:hypothetical protein [Armatimonadota bacterium]
MKIRETMPFASELLAPTYAESYARGGAAAAGEVTVDQSWPVVAGLDDPLVDTAADHLRHFLVESLGLPSNSGEGPAIRLRVDGTIGEDAETHLLRVRPDGIEVVGAGPAGVLQGVFYLESLMRERGGAVVAVGEQRRAPLFKHRIHRSPFSTFYIEELSGYDGPPLDVKWYSPNMDYPGFREEDAGPDMFYHDNLLLRLAEHGFNGIWIRGALSLFSKVEVFPEFGADSDRILAELRRLRERAGRYGLKVFIYLNEPMGMRRDHPFWQAHPEAQGGPSPYEPMMCLCTSTPEVRSYLREGCRYLFEQVPGLAGAVLISASEFPHHCYSHTLRPEDPEERRKQVEAGKLCPRCADRLPQEVVADTVNLINEGVKAGNPEAEVIAWNWSWNRYEPDPQRGVLERLASDVIVMGDYERGQPTEACGFEYLNDEYSIKVVGPSPRFTGVADFQRERQLPTYARIQIGTTHENPVVPYLPTPQKIAQKYQTLRETGVTGIMSCWNFGNMPSLGTEVASVFLWDPQPTVEEGLRSLAARRYGEAVADQVVAAWDSLSRAHDCFPSSIPVMYHGPLSRGPAFLFVFDQIDQKFPNSWLFDEDIRGDRLDWTAPFTPEQVLTCYRAEAEALAEGVGLLEKALAQTSGADRERLALDYGVAKFHRIQTLSSAHVLDFLLTRNAWYAAPEADKPPLLERIEAICRAELDNCAEALPLLDADPRLGWHGEGYGYMINRSLVEAKMAGLRQLLAERLPAERVNA